jgi:hypothetical protein
MPPVAGCFDTGGLGAIGGADTGVPAQNVWCCPATIDAGPPSGDGSVTDSAMAEASTDAGVQDATGE